MPSRLVLLLLLFLACPNLAFAHFGMVIPDKSMVMNKKEAKIRLDLAFAHPFAQSGMTMAAPDEFFVAGSFGRSDLTASLKAARYLGEPAFAAEYEIARPGVYQFAVVPKPYYEPAEQSFIIHYAKTIIGAFGHEGGWEKPLGLPVEIVPLSRPFGNYSGNTFTGQVLKSGKPLAAADVEVEYLNSGNRYEAPNSYFETQTVKTDENGVFTFGIPWPGWWGFAALTESDEKIDHGGAPKEVELGGIIWLEFFAPQLRK